MLQGDSVFVCNAAGMQLLRMYFSVGVALLACAVQWSQRYAVRWSRLQIGGGEATCAATQK